MVTTFWTAKQIHTDGGGHQFKPRFLLHENSTMLYALREPIAFVLLLADIGRTNGKTNKQTDALFVSVSDATN